MSSQIIKIPIKKILLLTSLFPKSWMGLRSLDLGEGRGNVEEGESRPHCFPPEISRVSMSEEKHL